MVNLDKSAADGEVVVLTCSWPDSTDYDLLALVEYADGHVEHVATFDAAGIKAQHRTHDGAVMHSGDQRRGDGTGRAHTASETIRITLSPQIASVAPVVYSAQSNGTGSFYRYGVSAQVVCAGQTVLIEAGKACTDDRVYSLVPAVIHNTADGVRLAAVETYSRPGSENRPDLRRGELVMDAGPRNTYK